MHGAALFQILEGGSFDVAAIVDQAAIGPVDFRWGCGLQYVFGKQTVEAQELGFFSGELAVVKTAPAVGFGFLNNARPHRIQFDVGAATQHTLAVLQPQTLEAVVPEIALAIVVFVVPAGKGLLDRADEFREIFELFSSFGYLEGSDGGIRRDFLSPLFFVCLSDEKFDATDDLQIAIEVLRVDFDHQMEMVAHDSKGNELHKIHSAIVLDEAKQGLFLSIAK